MEARKGQEKGKVGAKDGSEGKGTGYLTENPKLTGRLIAS